jgi:hypothetical protein
MNLFKHAPNSYSASKQLIAGDDLNNVVSQLNTAQGAITAHSGGGYPGFQLASSVNTITVAAADHDSLNLPIGFAGLKVIVFNLGAHIADVYGYGKLDTINALGANTPFSMAAGTKTMFVCLASPTPSSGATWETFTGT